VVEQLEHTLVIVVEELEVPEDLVVEVVQETLEQGLEVQVIHLLLVHLKEVLELIYLVHLLTRMAEVAVELAIMVVAQLEQLVALYKMDL
jgi:hypothetical protein